MLRLCLSRCKVHNVLKNNIKIISNNLIDCFNKNLVKKQYSTKNEYIVPKQTQDIIDDKNIFYSPWKDVDIHEGTTLHDHVWQNVDKWWDKTAVICSITGRSYTYGQLRVLSGRFATSLRKLKLKSGTSFAAILPNIPEFIIVAMGASEAGIPLTLINPSYTPREINHQLKNSKAGAVVTVSIKYQIVAEGINGIDSIQHPVIVIDGGSGSAPSGTINFKDLVADNIIEFKNTGENINIDVKNDTVILPYSSGTTGLPKGVELTHRNIVANLTQTDNRAFCQLEPAINDWQEICPIILPMFHSYGFLIFNLCLRFGGKLICMPIFTPDSLLDICEKYPLTGLSVVPPIIQLMVYDPRFTKKHVANIRGIVNGASSLNEDLINKLWSKFGETFVLIQGYGLTETSPTVTSGINRPPSSVGLCFPNTKMRIVGQSQDNFGKNLGFDEVGEILIKGPQVMKGYLNNPQATLDTMDGEWLKTGDLGRFDNDGNLWITGRLKELIKVNGMQVSPIELEDILRRHEKITDAAVIGVPHERFGEIPKAFVVAKKDVKINEDEIKNYVAEQVIEYKRIGQVVFIDQIPKSVVGKILRKELQNM